MWQNPLFFSPLFSALHFIYLLALLLNFHHRIIYVFRNHFRSGTKSLNWINITRWNSMLPKNSNSAFSIVNLTIVIFVLIMMILRFHNFPNSLCHCVKYADLLSTHVQFSFAFYQESWTLWIAIEGAIIGNWWVCEMSETSQLVLPLFQLPIVAPPIGETCNPQCSTLLLFIPSDFCLLLASINRLTQWNSWSYRKSMWWI